MARSKIKRKDGYIDVYKPSLTQNKRGYLKESRAVWLEHHGDIPKGSVIHHKDNNKANNDINNLELVASNGVHIRKYHSPYDYIDAKRELTEQEYNFIKDRLPLKQLGLLR